MPIMLVNLKKKCYNFKNLYTKENLKIICR